MTDSIFEHDSLAFRYRDEGSGIPVVFQHGLGGDLDVAFDLLVPLEGFRMVGFDARAHGATRPIGPVEKLSIRQTVDDLTALLDHLKIERAVVGGVSMGAAIALRFATLYPDRVLGLILSRPAWLDKKSPPNLAIFPFMAALIREYGPAESLERLHQSPEYVQLLKQCPDAAQAFAGHFAHPRLGETFEKFDRIPADSPIDDRSVWRSIAVPTLVLANHFDPIHPWEYAEEIAELIPSAVFAEIAAKSVSQARHSADFGAAAGRFLETNRAGWNRSLKVASR